MKKTKEIEKEIQKAEEKIGVSSLDVLSASGNFVRTYDVENHGLKFKELAEMYASKIKGKVVKRG